MLQQQQQHQIAQSPARLGLTSPRSPSPNNPTTTLQTTTASLLALVPPLPRAQTLLHQLSLLSSKLFEVSPNRSLWVSSFRGNLPAFLPAPHSPPTLQSPVTNTKQLLSQFSALQSNLFDTVSQLQDVLDIQDRIQRVNTQLGSLDFRIIDFAKKLRDVQKTLDVLVDDYRHLRTADGDFSILELSEVLSYAHRISYTTFAPPEFGAGQAALRGALPPAPQEEQMRASQLYAFADLDVGVPKRIVEGMEKVIEPIMEEDVLGPKIEVPSGWKPGMPVELPEDIPLMPAGWKPGDPIPLPPLDALAAAARAQEQQQQQVRPVVAQGMHRGNEPIQVAPVQLDIDADDSSDYSDSDASSDDDE